MLWLYLFINKHNVEGITDEVELCLSALIMSLVFMRTDKVTKLG